MHQTHYMYVYAMLIKHINIKSSWKYNYEIIKHKHSLNKNTSQPQASRNDGHNFGSSMYH